jgi:murein DD-endopeptidase MepM/ murein hydrolase activator NlpD
MRLPVVAFSLLFSSLAAAAPTTILNRRLEPGQTLAPALRATGIAEAQVTAIIHSLADVFDFKKSQVGDQFRLVLRDGQVQHFDYRRSDVEEWRVRRMGDALTASKTGIEIDKAVAVVELTVDSSLYEAAIAAGEDPQIALALSDVFAWDIDFYQDVRKGDRVRAVVEKYTAKGRILRYGDVMGAQYVGESVGTKRVFRYVHPDGVASYYQENGTSARKSFLKSPLKYAHVTSRFGSRFHPVLKYVKAHNGVDYGASIGTPVWAVADGVVTKAGYDGPAGNRVCLRHANSFETCYLHLSGYGRGVRVGARVSQKQVIAYTGNTGRSTGPHLHYALKRGGRYVNPLNQKFPRAEPIPTSLLADFTEKTREHVERLNGVSVAATHVPAPAPAAASAATAASAAP